MTRASTLDRLSVAVGAALVAATVVAALVFGLDGATSTAPTAASTGAPVDRVIIRNFLFDPEGAVVKAGTKVTFVNEDSAPHTATSSSDKSFDTGTLNKGDEKAVTFTKPGTIAYICTIHPFMKGTLKVVS